MMNSNRKNTIWNCLLCKIFILLFLLFYPGSNIAAADDAGQNKSKELSAVVQDLQKNLSSQTQGGRPLRLAVLVFTATQNDKQEKTGGFGEYFSENIITTLSKEKKIRLFERKRLDLILNENSLSLSGLINKDQAKKIGELVPIDAILSGTFTKLENYIDINSRVIDVVTGEIILAYADRINMTDDLRSLFQSGTAPKQVKAPLTEEDICAAHEKRIGFLLNDVSSPEKIEVLVQEAVKIPFEGKCSKIHYAVMRSFERYSIENADYEAFLMKSIAAIPHPSKDYRASDTLRFLAKKNKNAPGKWELCLTIVKKSDPRSIPGCLRPFVNYPYQPDELEDIYKRIEQYFSLLKKKEIGLPKPIEFNDGFIRMLNAVDNLSSTNNTVSLYVYSTYMKNLTYDKETVRTLNNYLPRVYLAEKNEEAKLKTLNYLCDFYNAREMDEKLADDLYQFAFRFKPTDYLKNNPEEAAKVPPAHLKILIEKCRPQFCKAFSYTKYKSQKDDRTEFCIEHNIECPSDVPTPESCLEMLSSKDWAQRARAMELLAKMGMRAKIAESAVIKALDRTSLEYRRESDEIHRFAVMILGNIKSEDPKALSLLITSLGSLEYNVPQLAVDSLVAIGKPAVPYLIKGLDNEKGSVQYKAAKALSRLGPAAKSARPHLQKMLKSNNKDLVIIAREALEEIGE